MNFGAETNQILDKLSTILGPTGGEIVTEYTKLEYVQGITGITIGFFFLIVAIFGIWILRVGMAERNENKQLIGGLSLLLGGAISFMSFLICVPKVMTPKATAIHSLLKQLQYMFSNCN